MESENKFYPHAYDRFQMFAMSELTESHRIKSLPDLLYYYVDLPLNECPFNQLLYYRYLAKSQTPLLPLKSLDDDVR